MGTRPSRRGRSAAAGTLAVCGVVAGAGVAAAADQTITTAAGNRFAPGSVTIDVGDTVMWTFPVGEHNAAATDDVAADRAWSAFRTSDVPSTGAHAYTFAYPGTYRFLCEAHATDMRGTVVVNAPPVETPAPPPPAAGATGEAPPPAGNQESTPPPPAADAERTAPALAGVRLRPLRDGARVTFELSEPAAVTLRVRRRGAARVLHTVRLQAAAGAHTMRVRSPNLTPGRYTVALSARDGAGNRSPVARAALRIRRS